MALVVPIRKAGRFCICVVKYPGQKPGVFAVIMGKSYVGIKQAALIFKGRLAGFPAENAGEILGIETDIFCGIRNGDAFILDQHAKTLYP